MNSFASGPKRNYYGKGDVIVYRLHRHGNEPAGQNPVFGANVKMLLYGDVFWPTYTSGDNSGLIATDSMKNFIQRETLQFAGGDLESYCRFLAEKFRHTYPQVEGIQVSAVEIPYSSVAASRVAFTPAGPERAWARVEWNGNGIVEAVSGLQGFRLLRLGGSSFKGFVRDQYTTLPEITNRPLHMWLDLDWSYITPEEAFHQGAVTEGIRKLIQELFHGFESGSIQEVIYQIGTKILNTVPAIAKVNLEAHNRTWDTIVEEGEALGIYTDARPPYGCLGLSLSR